MTETDFLKREVGSGRMMGFRSSPSPSRIMGMGMDMDTRQRSASRKSLLMLVLIIGCTRYVWYNNLSVRGCVHLKKRTRRVSHQGPWSSWACTDCIVDRRPVDPPPVVELLLDNTYDPFFFSLVQADR